MYQLFIHDPDLKPDLQITHDGYTKECGEDDKDNGDYDPDKERTPYGSCIVPAVDVGITE